jgi:predicted NBD/HSP70 family sugar kinase
VRTELSVGIDIGGTKLLGAALRGDGARLHRAATGRDATPGTIVREILAFVAELDATPTSMGVAVPGLVDASGRIVACSHLPALIGWRPADDLEHLGCTVHVLNDADAALAEEARDFPAGATAGVIMVGTAVGAGFVVEGRPLRGASGWAGELGHIPVRVGDRITVLDEVAGGDYLVRRLDLPGAEIAARAAAGDAAVQATVRAAGEALGLGLATVVNLLNPSLLALGGGTLRIPGYYEAAVEAGARLSLPDLWRACEVRRVRAGETVVALGASQAAMRVARGG